MWPVREGASFLSTLLISYSPYKFYRPLFLNHRFGLALPLGVYYACIRIVMPLY